MNVPLTDDEEDDSNDSENSNSDDSESGEEPEGTSDSEDDADGSSASDDSSAYSGLSDDEESEEEDVVTSSVKQKSHQKKKQTNEEPKFVEKAPTTKKSVRVLLFLSHRNRDSFVINNHLNFRGIFQIPRKNCRMERHKNLTPKNLIRSIHRLATIFEEC